MFFDISIRFVCLFFFRNNFVFNEIIKNVINAILNEKIEFILSIFLLSSAESTYDYVTILRFKLYLFFNERKTFISLTFSRFPAPSHPHLMFTLTFAFIVLYYYLYFILLTEKTAISPFTTSTISYLMK